MAFCGVSSVPVGVCYGFFGVFPLGFSGFIGGFYSACLICSNSCFAVCLVPSWEMWKPSLSSFVHLRCGSRTLPFAFSSSFVSTLHLIPWVVFSILGDTII